MQADVSLEILGDALAAADSPPLLQIHSVLGSLSLLSTGADVSPDWHWEDQSFLQVTAGIHLASQELWCLLFSASGR